MQVQRFAGWCRNPKKKLYAEPEGEVQVELQRKIHTELTAQTEKKAEAGIHRPLPAGIPVQDKPAPGLSILVNEPQQEISKELAEDLLVLAK
ncbi:hypothetical protein ACFSQ7_35285 [Paenibacillus rhizoplanae]